MAKQREIDLSDKTEAASPTEPSSKRKKRSPLPAEHIKTIHEAWLKACAPGENRKLYEFDGTDGSEFILATSLRQANSKWMELTKFVPVSRLMKAALATRMAKEMSLFAERELGARNGNPSHDEPAGLAAGSPEPEPRTGVPAGRLKGPSGTVPF
jgi:hypothetical protein